MGRSAGGGSSSGGSRSSGGSSRSSGGHRHSSSSRSSRSSSYSSSSRSSSGSYSGNRYIRNTYYGGSRGYSTRGYGDMYYDDTYRRQSRNIGVMHAVMIIVFIALAMCVAGSVVSVNKSRSIPYSTVQREPLDKSNVNVTKYYEDNLDWITSEAKVNKAMEYFFDKTGVQPYLLITDNILGDTWPKNEDIDEYLNSIYDIKFTDEQHMILLYLDNGDSWLTRYMCGKTARNVMDEEACEIMLSFFDYYATSDMDDDEYFSTSFMKAADRIMSYGKTDNRLIYLLGGSVLLLVALIALFIITKHKEKIAESRAKELRAAESIINSDAMIDSDLKDKYK